MLAAAVRQQAGRRRPRWPTSATGLPSAEAAASPPCRALSSLLPGAASPADRLGFRPRSRGCPCLPLPRRHRLAQARTGVFVSRHNTALNVSREDILRQCGNAGLLEGCGTAEPYRTTSTHVILAECPLCPKPTGGRADNMYKLYVATGGGAYYCHRCGAGGSWFDFCRKLGSGGGGAGQAVEVVGAAGWGANGPPSRHPARAAGAARSPIRREGGASAACLPMPPQRLAAAHITSLLDYRDEGDGSDGPCTARGDGGNNALRYLTEERGLTTRTLRKYGVGRAHYDFPSTNPGTASRYEKEECVTFPWIMRASEVNDQEGMREPPGRYDWAEEKEEEEKGEDGGKDEGRWEIQDEKEGGKGGRLEDGEQVPASTAAAVGPWTTRRIKARSLSHKGHQRLDPAGGGWGLFGWHTVPPDATAVVLTEGEYDAMAVYQATGRPAVSLPNGCRSLPLEVLPLMERFETIYLWMDNDGPGREGAEKFTKKLGAKRCLIVKPSRDLVGPSGLPPKDANDALRMGMDLDAMLDEADIMPHDQLLRFGDLRDQVLHEILHPDKYTGVGVPSMPLFTSIVKGFRRGEMTLVTGPTGSGKTTFLGQLSLDFAEQGVNTLWGSFEIKNTRLVAKLLQQFGREPLPIGRTDQVEAFTALADRFEELPLHFLRFHGGSDIDDVLEAMKYAVYVHDVEHIILDNMQFMMSRDQGSFGSSYDKFEHQDLVVTKFRKFATEQNVHVTLVCHPRKEDEGARLGISSVFGGAKATQEADTVLILQYDGKRKYIEVKKNRYDGTLGMAPLHFERSSGRYNEKPATEFSGGRQTTNAAAAAYVPGKNTFPDSPAAIMMAGRQISSKAAARPRADSSSSSGHIART